MFWRKHSGGSLFTPQFWRKHFYVLISFGGRFLWVYAIWRKTLEELWRSLVFLPPIFLASSNICFYVLFTKKTSKGPLIALFLFLMTLHLEFLQSLSLGSGTE